MTFSFARAFAGAASVASASEAICQATGKCMCVLDSMRKSTRDNR